MYAPGLDLQLRSHTQQSRPTNVRLLSTAAMSVLSLFLMSQVSASATLLFGSAMASITFVAPAVLVRAQTHKKFVESFVLAPPTNPFGKVKFAARGMWLYLRFAFVAPSEPVDLCC